MRIDELTGDKGTAMRVIHDPFGLGAERMARIVLPDTEEGWVGPSFLTLTAAAILGEVEKMVGHVTDRHRAKGESHCDDPSA